jgi:transposase
VDAQKKTIGAAERDEGARQEWREGAPGLDPRRLVFVDEFGVHTGMGRGRARSPRGRRAHGKAPRNRGANTTVITSLTLTGIREAMTVEGAADTAVFEAYVRHSLAPTLLPGQVVIMDNLSAHKGERVRGMIEGRGARLLFLPAYSPDLNPIEEAISKMKGIIRSEGARSSEALQGAIAGALDAVTAQDALGYFAHCGYPPNQYL